MWHFFSLYISDEPEKSEIRIRVNFFLFSLKLRSFFQWINFTGTFVKQEKQWKWSQLTYCFIFIFVSLMCIIGWFIYSLALDDDVFFSSLSNWSLVSGHRNVNKKNSVHTTQLETGNWFSRVTCYHTIDEHIDSTSTRFGWEDRSSICWRYKRRWFIRENISNAHISSKSKITCFDNNESIINECSSRFTSSRWVIISIYYFFIN